MTSAKVKLCRWSVWLGVGLCLLSVVSGFWEEKRKPTYLESQVGSFVVFNCRLQFPLDTPIPYMLHWYKENRSVFSWYDGDLTASEQFVGRINLLDHEFGLGKASVNLTAIRESDAGWYQCQVVFPNRTPNTRGNGTWFHLTVDGGALMKIPPINTTILEGETAFFHCVVKHPDTSYVTWFKDGRPLSEMHDLSHRSNIGPDGSLSINPTIMSDLGEYRCHINDHNGDVQSAKAFLNVQYKAKVIYAPSEVYLAYGQPAILDCHFRSNPPLTNLRWEKDGFLFDPYNVQGVFYKPNGSLYFNKVDESHTGSYSCTPYNELGTDGPSPLIHVIVQKPPIITVKPKPLYIYKLGDNVTFPCDARDKYNYQRPQILWMRKDGNPLPLDRITIDYGNITIEKIVEADRGIYQCVVSNEAAIMTVDTELMIENIAAYPPYNLTTNSSSTAITVRWEPGVARPTTQYNIWYRLADGPEWRTIHVRNKIKTEVTIPYLEPAREYEIMVLAQNTYGDGVFSKPHRYFTKPREYQEPEHYRDPISPFVQIGPPKNVSIEIVGEGYLVKWLPPDYGRDVLRVYLVRWYLQPKHILHGQSETRNTYYVIENLDEDELYDIQVMALSTTDYEAGSDLCEFYVPPYRRMRAVAIGTATILVILLIVFLVLMYMKRKWVKPHDHHEIEKSPH